MLAYQRIRTSGNEVLWKIPVGFFFLRSKHFTFDFTAGDARVENT